MLAVLGALGWAYAILAISFAILPETARRGGPGEGRPIPAHIG